MKSLLYKEVNDSFFVVVVVVFVNNNKNKYFDQIWQTRIEAACREHHLGYFEFMESLTRVSGTSLAHNISSYLKEKDFFVQRYVGSIFSHVRFSAEIREKTAYVIVIEQLISFL